MDVEMLKSARRCGTKHIWNSRCTKQFSIGTLSEVELLKKCMLLEREAHFPKSKCEKHTMPGALLEVEMLKKCTMLEREAHFPKST